MLPQSTQPVGQDRLPTSWKLKLDIIVSKQWKFQTWTVLSLIPRRKRGDLVRRWCTVCRRCASHFFTISRSSDVFQRPSGSESWDTLRSPYIRKNLQSAWALGTMVRPSLTFIMIWGFSRPGISPMGRFTGHGNLLVFSPSCSSVLYSNRSREGLRGETSRAKYIKGNVVPTFAASQNPQFS